MQYIWIKYTGILELLLHSMIHKSIGSDGQLLPDMYTIQNNKRSFHI